MIVNGLKKNKMRNPIDVVKQIKKVIPKEHYEKCDWLINDFSYKSPEQVGLCFKRLHESLFYDIIPEIMEEEWQFEVVSIYTGKTIKEVKEVNEQLKG